MGRVNFKPISMPADWLNFRFTPFQIHEHLYSRAEATSCLLITHWANNKHDPKTQETRRETENWKQETNKPQNFWLAFHLLGSRYVVRLMLVVCPPKRKSRQRNEISKILQRKSKLQVYSKFESFGPVQRLCNTFSVSPRVCVYVCATLESENRVQAATLSGIESESENPSAAAVESEFFSVCKWSPFSWFDFWCGVFGFRALNTSLSISSPKFSATWIHFTSIDRRFDRQQIGEATMEAEEVTKLVDGVYRVSHYNHHYNISYLFY